MYEGLDFDKVYVLWSDCHFVRQVYANKYAAEFARQELLLRNKDYNFTVEIITLDEYVSRRMDDARMEESEALLA